MGKQQQRPGVVVLPLASGLPDIDDAWRQHPDNKYKTADVDYQAEQSADYHHAKDDCAANHAARRHNPAWCDAAGCHTIHKSVPSTPARSLPDHTISRLATNAPADVY
jgi:hypothetical protein